MTTLAPTLDSQLGTDIPDSGEIFGHPKGLYVLFFTEMWERFSYYGMRALLVLYMMKYLLPGAEGGMHIAGYGAVKAFIVWIMALFGQHEITTQAISSQIYGLYTGLVYFTPFFGGILADKVFGQRKSVYIGGALMAIGHFLMAVESMFFPALLFLILGNGCFKPNISTQVGLLYKQGDPRRDSAFTIFYMGINLGAFFSPLVCGTLGQTVGWHYGFAAAGVGMLVGLAVYHFGKHLLPADRMMVREAKHIEKKAPEPLTKQEKSGIWALIFLCIVNIVFWAAYEQQGNTLQLWADQNTNWSFAGWTVPSSWYQSFNPGFIFLMAPLLDRWWAFQSKKGRTSTSTTKMGIGCMLLGLAFVIMIFASKVVAPTEKGSLLWLVATTWLFTMGELYLSPIGLSLVTKIAPARLVSMMMGMWLMSSFFGNYLSGFIGGYYELMSKQAFFTLLMVLGVSAGLIFFAANKPLKRAIGDV